MSIEWQAHHKKHSGNDEAARDLYGNLGPSVHLAIDLTIPRNEFVFRYRLNDSTCWQQNQYSIGSDRS